MSNSDSAAKQLAKIHNRIASAAVKANRDVAAITLVGAAKQQSAGSLYKFYNAGLRHTGENYLQEAIDKQSALENLDYTWHFIGNIQSNKINQIARCFSWIHTLDRIKVAQRFAAHCPPGKTLQVLIQLNMDHETSKGGIAPEQAAELSSQICRLPNLNLRGFMLLPKFHPEFDAQRRSFSLARKLLEQTNQRYGINMDTLSMGMSQDLEAAVIEGATMLRIGTDLFGTRAK